MRFDIRPWRALRTVLGLLTGTVATTLLAVPWLYFDDVGGYTLWWPHFDRATLKDSLATCIPALTVSVPLGLIGHALLYRLRMRSIWHYLTSGLLAGLLFQAVLGLGANDPQLWAFFAAWAAACALLTWLIRRPDRDASTPAETHF